VSIISHCTATMKL